MLDHVILGGSLQQWTFCLLERRYVLLQANQLEILALQPFYNREQNGFSCLLANAFGLKVFLEFLHVVGTDTEDIKRLQKANEFRMLYAGNVTAALEREVMALEPDATPKQLDDFRAFGSAYIHESHGAYPPGTPTFGKLLGAYQQIDGRSLLIDGLEQGGGKGLVGHRHIGISGFSAELDQFGSVSHVDQPKPIVFAHAQADLTATAFEMHHMQVATGVGMKHLVQDILEQRLCLIGIPLCLQIREGFGEYRPARLITKIVLLLEQQLQVSDRFTTTIGDETGEKM